MAWINNSSFWHPNFLERSAWVDHAPFAFWLVSILQPRLLVELGTHRGYSYFSFCQAVQKLGLQTHCHAVDTWKGDEHAGFYGEEIFQHVENYNNTHYAPFSRLIRSTFDESLDQFADASIDLLHVDDVKHDFESWRPKLSDCAIVLFPDTQVRERDFGVFRLWEELSAGSPAFEFFHGRGLGVLGYGANLPDGLASFFGAASDPAVAAEIRSAYGRLGESLKAAFDAAHAQEQLAAKLKKQEPRRRCAASPAVCDGLREVFATRCDPCVVACDCLREAFAPR